MPGSNLPFTASEYDRRLARTRAAMSARHLDLLFVEDPSNMAWLTGYDGWSFYVHQGVLITHDQAPVWWGRAQDAAGAVRTVYMADDRVMGYPDRFIQATDCHPMENLADWIRANGYADKRIGVELENYYFSAKAYLVLRAELPNADMVDATALVNWQRTVKSPEELAYMHQAARIAEKMIDGLLERIEPGLPKNELVADLYRDAIRGTGGAWGDYPAIVPLLPSGTDAAAPHLTWDGKPVRKGEATFFEIAGCVRRYHVPFCRTVFLGKPPQDMLDAEAALAEGLAAGLEAARPGEHRRRHRPRAVRLAGKGRHRARRPLRLSHRPVLSAGLGRTHHLHSQDRRHRA